MKTTSRNVKRDCVVICFSVSIKATRIKAISTLYHTEPKNVNTATARHQSPLLSQCNVEVGCYTSSTCVAHSQSISQRKLKNVNIISVGNRIKASYGLITYDTFNVAVVIYLSVKSKAELRIKTYKKDRGHDLSGAVTVLI